MKLFLASFAIVTASAFAIPMILDGVDASSERTGVAANNGNSNSNPNCDTPISYTICDSDCYESMRVAAQKQWDTVTARQDSITYVTVNSYVSRY